MFSNRLRLARKFLNASSQIFVRLFSCVLISDVMYTQSTVLQVPEKRRGKDNGIENDTLIHFTRRGITALRTHNQQTHGQPRLCIGLRRRI